MRVIIQLFCLSFLILVSGSAAMAVTAQQWVTQDQDGFAKGKMDGLVINSDGELIAAPKYEKVQTDEVAIWCSVTTPTGETYFGTGKTGNIYKLDGKKIVPVVKNTGFVVTTLAADNKGNVYAASLPGGRITRIEPNGNSKVLATLEVLYIWSLQCDSKGNLYAGTGPAGRLFRVTEKGNPVLLYDSEADHIFSLAIDAKDNLYFGTAHGATLLKIRAEDAMKEKVKAQVVHDFDGSELKAIQPVGDALYVAVNKTRDGSAEEVASALYEAAEDIDEEDEGIAPESSGTGGMVYKLAAGSRKPERVTKSGESFILGMKVDNAGDVFIAVAGDGMIRYSARTLTRAKIEIQEKQVLTMDLKAGKLHILGTSGPGVLYFSQPSVKPAPNYTSQVFSSGVPAKWGNLAWDAHGTLKMEVRSGMTQAPDETWTPWKALAGSGEAAATGQTPYIQYRATWPEKEPQNAVLRQVELSYIEANVSPKMKEISVGTGDKGSKSSRKSKSSSPTVKVRWKADDDNKDTLGYRIYYRLSSESNWKQLNPDKLLTKTDYLLEKQKFPAGEYVLRIEVTDEASNPGERALADTLESKPFVLDSDRPTVTLAKIVPVENENAVLLTGNAADGISTIASIEYSIDGQAWKSLFPSDDIYDSKTEPFTLKIAVEEKGAHGVAIRATDAQGNTSVVHGSFQTQ